MIQLTDDERDLLRAAHRIVCEVVAVPDRVADLRARMCGGGYREFSYEIRDNKLAGTWCHFEVLEGQRRIFKLHPPHRKVSISLPRLKQWAESLPAEIRDRALAAWRVHPVNTRDIPRLYRITLEAIDHDRPKQLALFEEAV
ncbi:hypothetical protein [Gordonia paraffinivorans]|uniref:hypothetical protein n=1 Tax=Gordonia paraffinivorans TaxID=175628 RepID=UPI003FCD0A5D